MSAKAAAPVVDPNAASAALVASPRPVSVKTDDDDDLNIPRDHRWLAKCLLHKEVKTSTTRDELELKMVQQVFWK